MPDVERVVGTIRREYLAHVIVLNEGVTLPAREIRPGLLSRMQDATSRWPRSRRNRGPLCAGGLRPQMGFAVGTMGFVLIRW